MHSPNDIVDTPIHEPDSDYNFSEGFYFPPQFKIVGVVFIVAGIALCLKLNLLGPVVLFLGLVAVLAKKVLTVSFSLCRYRYSMAIVNFRFGKWIIMPAFESISIFSAKKRQDMFVGSQSTTATYSEIEVNLIYHNNRRLTVYETQDYNSALGIARQFADKLTLRIYDATKREGEWIE